MNHPCLRIRVFIGLLAGLILFPIGSRASTTPPRPDAPAPPQTSPGAQADHASLETHPTLLLVEPEHIPAVSIEWVDGRGTRTMYSGQFPYSSDAGRADLGGNIKAFVSVGGTRLTKGAGHPKGAIVRVGFYKDDKAKPWFPEITAGTEITIRLKGVAFNQPIDADPRSIIQHLKYDPGDMESCGIPGDAREQFNTADPHDTLNDRTRPGIDARLGTLAVERPIAASDRKAIDTDDESVAEPSPALGTASLTVRDDRTADLEVTFRYAALRNLRDPWKSNLPGTFLEPVHFHVEFEALPRGAEPMPKARPKD